MIVCLVSRRLALCRDRNSSRQQPGSPISHVADAFAYTGAPGDPRRVEGVLKKHRYVKLLPAKPAGQAFLAPESFVLAFVVINDDAVGIALPAIEIRDPRAREDRNFGGWPAGSNRPQRRNGHHRIAHPVGRPNENFHACVTGCDRPTVASTAAQKAFSSL